MVHGMYIHPLAAWTPGQPERTETSRVEGQLYFNNLQPKLHVYTQYTLIYYGIMQPKTGLLPELWYHPAPDSTNRPHPPA